MNALLLSCALLTAAILRASTASEEFRPSTSGPLVSYTAYLSGPGALLVQPLVSVGLLRGGFDALGQLAPNDGEGYALASSLSLFIEAGLQPNLCVGTQLTGLLNRRGDSAQYIGWGDTLVFARARFLDEARGDFLSAALLLQLKFPTGNAVGSRALMGADVVGTGFYDLMVGLNVSKRLWPALLHLDVIGAKALSTAVGDQLFWSAALEVPLFGERAALLSEASGRHQNPAPHGAVGADELALIAGVEWLATESVQLLLAYQRTVWGRNVPAADAFTLTVVPTFQLLR